MLRQKAWPGALASQYSLNYSAIATHMCDDEPTTSSSKPKNLQKIYYEGQDCSKTCTQYHYTYYLIIIIIYS